MSDVDLIRPPSPRLDRAALAVIALIAAASFTSGLARQVIGPLSARVYAESPAEAAEVRPAAPVTQPSMQVAAAEPAPRPAPKRLDIPDPAPPPPAVEPSGTEASAIAAEPASPAVLEPSAPVAVPDDPPI